MPSDTFPVGARVHYNEEPCDTGRVLPGCGTGRVGPWVTVQWEEDGQAITETYMCDLTRLPDDLTTIGHYVQRVLGQLQALDITDYTVAIEPHPPAAWIIYDGGERSIDITESTDVAALLHTKSREGEEKDHE